MADVNIPARAELDNFATLPLLSTLDSEQPKRKRSSKRKLKRAVFQSDSYQDTPAPVKRDNTINSRIDVHHKAGTISSNRSNVQGSSAFREDGNFFRNSAKTPPVKANEISNSEDGAQLGTSEESNPIHETSVSDSDVPSHRHHTTDPNEGITRSEPGGISGDAQTILPSNNGTSEVAANDKQPPHKNGCSGKKTIEVTRNRTTLPSKRNLHNTIIPQNGTCGASRKTQQATQVPDLGVFTRRSLGKEALAGISVTLIFLASLPIFIAIFRRHRRHRKNTIDKNLSKEFSSQIGYPKAQVEPESGQEGEITPAQMEELMNRIASVQNRSNAFNPNNFSK